MTTMAPALMKGLRGMPRSNSSWTIELKGLPDGSRPTRRHSRSPNLPSASVSVKTLEMLWIENGVSAVACRRDVSLGVDHRNPERLRIGARKLRNIGRDLAAVGPLPHLVCDFFDDAFKLRHGCGPRNHREPAVVGGL